MAFVAAAWKGSLDDTAAAAAEIMPSGRIQWGLDADETVFAAFGVPYQPVTVMIGSDKTVVDSWPGALGEEEIRAKLDTLVSG